MAGAAVRVAVRDADLRQALRRLTAKGDAGLVQACLKNIGLAVVKQTRRHFEQQRDPEGQAWAPLNPDYAKGKRGTKILEEQGMAGGLEGSITSVVHPGYVEIGTNKVYGAIHQFGGTIRPRSGEFLVFKLGGKTVLARKVTIPARPYLGLSPQDKAELLDIVEDHIVEIWNGK
jgi:phage virion morphogenesis protein